MFRTPHRTADVCPELGLGVGTGPVIPIQVPLAMTRSIAMI
jgi:hypothetical protein